MITVKRPEVANRIHDAKEHGDLSENAEYEDAKNEQAFVEGRIQTLEALIKNATIIDENHSTDHVQIGSTVERRERRRQGDLHDRRLGRGQARRGPDLEREPGRSRPARQEEGREGRREGPGRRLHLQDRQHHLRATAAPWIGPTNSHCGSVDAGPQVVNDSKTPSGTVHVGSLRGPVILDAIARALRANGVETTLPVRGRRPRPDGRPGAPDARRHRRGDGRPLAHVPDQATTPRVVRPPPRRHLHRHLRRPRHPPDRYYWMSDIYPTGEMDPFIRTALDRAALVRDIYRRVPTSSTPTRGTRSASSARPAARSARRSSPNGTASGSSTSAAPTSSPGPRGCGQRLDLAVRRRRQAALEPRVGGPVVAVRRDDRAVRQGPVDRRRLARPLGRDRARGVRARAAAQRALRVPEHRRQEDVDVEGSRRRAHTIAEVVPPEQLRFLFLRPNAQSRHRLRPRRHRPDPAPVRRVRQVRGRDAGREVRGELPPGYEATFRYSLLDPDADVAAEAAASGRPSAISRCWSRYPAWTSPSGRREKGSALTERELAILDERGAAARAGSTAMRRSAPIAGAGGAAGRGRGARRRPARVPRRARRRRGDGAPRAGDAWQA